MEEKKEKEGRVLKQAGVELLPVLPGSSSLIPFVPSKYSYNDVAPFRIMIKSISNAKKLYLIILMGTLPIDIR